MKVIWSLILLLQIGGILSEERLFQDKLESVCVNNGGLKALTNFQNAVTDLQQCGGRIGEEISAEAQKTGKMESVVAPFCAKIETLKGCFKPFVASFKGCLEKEQHEIVDFSYKIAVSGLQFVCDNSKDIEEALKSKDISCLPKKTETLKGCLDQLSIAFNASNDPRSTANTPTDLVNKKFGNDTKSCNDLLNFQKCSINAWNECEDKKFANLLDSMYKYTNNEIPCSNLPKSKASTSSVLSVFVLIIPMIVMYL